MGSIVARIQAQPNRGTAPGVTPAEDVLPSEDRYVGFTGAIEPYRSKFPSGERNNANCVRSDTVKEFSQSSAVVSFSTTKNRGLKISVKKR